MSGATEVYRSVDEDGNVQFSDEPPDGVESEVIELKTTKPPSSPSVIGRPRTNQPTGSGLDPAAAEREAARLELLANQQLAALERRCNEARVALEVLHQGMPVYRVGDGEFRAAWKGDTFKGTRTYLDDATRSKEIDAALRKLVMNCENPLDMEEQYKASSKWERSERCTAARADLEAVTQPYARAPDQSIAERQKLVDQYCDD